MRAYPLQHTADLGAACRHARQALGLTLADAAGAAGVSFRFASELERGKPSCQIERSLKYAQMLGIRFILESPVDLPGAPPRRKW